MDIPDDIEEDFYDNINFYILCLLLGGNDVYKILKNGSKEKSHFINSIFQSSSRESPFQISYFVGIPY